MKAFLASLIAILIIAVGTAFGLETLGWDANQFYQSDTGSVRVD